MDISSKPKHEFAAALRPFFDMLMARRSELTEQEWLNLVNRTMEAVTKAPDQYIGKDLPPHTLTAGLIHEVFEDFMLEATLLEGAAIA